MPLETTYLNERLELFDGVYDQRQHDELTALLRPYNAFLGPVTGVSVYRPELLDLSMFSGMARHTNLRALTPHVLVRPRRGVDAAVPGGGKGGSMRPAFLGALGEMAERLLGVLHLGAVLEQLVHASHSDLVRKGRRALGPRELPLFAPQQYARPGFGYSPFTPDTPLSWIEGHALESGEPVLIPAQLVLFHYNLRAGEPRIAYATTGGLGFHCDRRRAILHGLYEFIERDAINLRWYSRLPPSRVDVDLTEVLDRVWDMRQARMSTPYIEGVSLYLNTLDVDIPVLTASCLDTSRQDGAFVSGGGAWAGRDRALRQALFELGQSRNFSKLYDPVTMKDIRADTAVAEMTDFFHAAVYYGYAENLPRLSWYLDGGGSTPWESVPTLRCTDEAEEYEMMLGLLRAARVEPIVTDLNGAGWPGVSIVKVLIPQLTQASVPSHPFLGHPRYYEMPVWAGMTDHPLTFDELNPDPLPLP